MKRTIEKKINYMEYLSLTEFLKDRFGQKSSSKIGLNRVRITTHTTVQSQRVFEMSYIYIKKTRFEMGSSSLLLNQYIEE